MNSGDDIKLINTEKIKACSIDDFDIFKLNTDADKPESVDRLAHLRDVLNAKIPDHAKSKLLPLCFEFSDIFQLSCDKPTINNFYTQKLSVTDDIPVYTKNYRLPQSQRAEINKQVQNLLEDDLIEMSMSNYNSPLIVVPKKSPDGQRQWRMCVDFRALNKKLIPDKFPLPRIDEILDGLGRAKYFSVMDLKSGYHQIPLESESRKYTAFTTDSGFFQWKVLPFGLNIAPASFMRMMTLAFSGLSYERCFICMDDLIVIGFNENQHINNLRRVFEACKKYNLKLNPSKCEFYRTEVCFLGHKCTSEGLMPDPMKLRCVKNYPKPKDKNETKRFVAFANYYRRFIRNFSGITRPLTRLTSKKIKFIWSDECDAVFKQIKEMLLSPPILAYPDFSKPFRLTVDASNGACGGVLSQDFDGKDRPITFLSRTFKKGELNKAIIEKELIAIHYAITFLRPYLYGNKFIVYSDHKPLLYLYNLKNPTSRLARLRLDLEEYDFEIHHIRGTDNVVADALSRISIDDLSDMYAENQILSIKSTGENKNQKVNTGQKTHKSRSINRILAITRSMTKNEINIEPNYNTQSEIDTCSTSIHAFDELIQLHKKIPKTRVTNVEIKNGELKSVMLTIYKKHRKLCDLFLNQDNERLTVKLILSKLQNLAKTHNINKIEWPLYDKIFELCELSEFKRIANETLGDLQIY